MNLDTCKAQGDKDGFGTIVGTVVLAVWETDAAGSAIGESLSWRALTGQTPEEASGDGWLNAVHPDDRACVARRWRDAVARGEQFDAEYRVRQSDGGWCWTHARAVPLRSGDGRISGWTGITTGLGDRDNSEGESRQPVAAWHTLLDSIDEGFCIQKVIFEGAKAVDYVFVETNAAFERHTGLTDAKGRSIREFAPDLEERWFEMYGNIARSGVPARFQNWAEDLGRWYDVYAFRYGDPEEHLVGVLFRDITDRMHAVEALRETERKYRELVQYAPSAIYEIDFRRRRFVTVNDAMCHMLGYSRNELLEMDPFTLLDEEGRARFQKRLEQWLAGETPARNVEYRIATQSGRTMTAILDVSYTMDEDGNPLGATVIAHDITERKRAEEALRESYALIDSVLNNTHMLVAHMDRDFNFHMVNRTYAEADGKAPAFFPGKNHFDLYPNPENEAIFRQVVETGKPYFVYAKPFEYPENPERGTSYWDWSLIPTHGSAGNVTGLVMTLADVTPRVKAEQALRESEERFRMFMDNSPTFAWMKDEEGRYVYLSRTYQERFGLPLEDACGKTDAELWPAKTAEMFRNNDLAVWRAGKPMQMTEETRNLDGSLCYGLVSKFPFYDALGRRYVGGIALDITDRKRAEDALIELNETLELRVQERTREVEQQALQLRALAGQLSSTEQRERKRLARILHDHIQQLIVAAQMQVDWMTRDQNFTRVRTTARGVHGMLQEALQASRSLTVELSPPVLQETGLIGGLNWLASRMQETHQFSVNLRASNRAEPPTEDVRFLLFECVRELLLNAVKHSGVRKADVTLARKNKNSIWLSVRDKGAGFNPDVVRKRRPEESSFGLFSIQERVAQLGGRMELDSAPGRGTEVTLIVPVAEERPPAEESPPSMPPSREQHAVQMRRSQDVCNILIVDDHQIMRQGLSRLFEFESDIEVMGEAADGPQAVELASRLKPDVVVMDVNLGEMDGVETTRRILAEDPEIKVIGLSMHIDQAVANAMLDAGATAYLTKGGPSEDLIEAIRACKRE